MDFLRHHPRKGDNAVRAVKNASFDIHKGETFSLVGESGSGKTTIGRAVIRVNPCAAGEILYKGVRISGKIPRSLDREVIRNIQMVFQDPAASLNERATVDYIISEGLYNFHLYENEADRVAKVEKMIEEVGLLPEHLTRYPHEFSGGQRQRIGLARAMVMEPELVDIGHGHWIYGNKKEIEEYKQIREKNVPLKSIAISYDEEEVNKKIQESGELHGSNYILSRPLHDTGSIWLGILSFFLSILGLIGAAIFRKFNYIRNSNSCKKGALVGLAVKVGLVLIFLIMLLIAAH